MVDNLGYHFLFDPPYWRTIAGIVHVPTLLAQLVGLLIVGGSAWFLAATATSRADNHAKAGTEDKGSPSMERKLEFDPSRVSGAEIDANTPSRRNALRMAKRIVVALFAFLASGVLIAIWNEYMPATGSSGALMAVAAVGLVLGAWRWSASFK